jgi:mono/diheme cytochrome c family protein
MYRNVSGNRVFAGAALILVATMAATLDTVPAVSAQQPAAVPQEEGRTILDRVFSVAQADRGESRFKQTCSGCHQQGEFAEPRFSARWEGQSLGDIYDFMIAAMPENDPGGLKLEEYADLLAFFLGQSGYPVGYDDLPADTAVLSKIGIVPQPK